MPGTALPPLLQEAGEDPGFCSQEVATCNNSVRLARRRRKACTCEGPGRNMEARALPLPVLGSVPHKRASSP
eukprot:9304942-Prorocentrum_lima.AAC.1